MRKLLTLLTARTKFDKKLAWLYLLNVSDYIFTLILLSSGNFIEANPMLNAPINSVWGFVLKIIVPLMLVTYVHIRTVIAPPVHIRVISILLNIIIGYYAIINAFHLLWLSLMTVGVF